LYALLRSSNSSRRAAFRHSSHSELAHAKTAAGSAAISDLEFIRHYYLARYATIGKNKCSKLEQPFKLLPGSLAGRSWPRQGKILSVSVLKRRAMLRSLLSRR